MQLIGLTGGIAMGKSTAAHWLAGTAHIPLIDADAICRQLLSDGGAAVHRVARAFPGAVGARRAGGAPTIDRALLADIVFGCRERRRLLEAILHPLIQRRIMALVAYYWAIGCARVILDIPLLFETGMDRLMTYTVVVVVADEALQLARLEARSGAALSAEQGRARIAAQMSIEEKCRRATVVVHNEGSLEDLHRRLDEDVVRCAARAPSLLLHRLLLWAVPLCIAAACLVWWPVRGAAAWLLRPATGRTSAAAASAIWRALRGAPS